MLKTCIIIVAASFFFATSLQHATVCGSETQHSNSRLYDSIPRTTSYFLVSESASLAVGTDERGVVSFDLKSRIIAGRYGGGRPVALSPDARYLATQEKDTIRVWDVHTGKMAWSTSAKSGSQAELTFSNDSTLMFAVGTGRTPLAYTTKTGIASSPMSDFEGSQSFGCCSPTGTLIMTSADRTMLTAYSFATMSRVSEVRLAERFSADIGISPCGKMASIVCDDGSIHIWDIASKVATQIRDAPTGRVGSVCFSPDSKYLFFLLSKDSYTSKIASTATKTIVGEFSSDNPIQFSAFIDSRQIGILTRTSFTIVRIPDAKVLRQINETSGNAERFWRMPASSVLILDGNALSQWSIENADRTHRPLGHVNRISTITSDATGSFILTIGDDPFACVWDREGRGAPRIIKSSRGAILSCALSPGATSVASISADRCVEVEVIEGKKVRRSFLGRLRESGQNPAIIYLDQKTIATFAREDPSFFIFNLSEPGAVEEVHLPWEAGIVDFCVSGSGRHIAVSVRSAGGGQNTLIWTRAGEKVRQSAILKTGGKIALSRHGAMLAVADGQFASTWEVLTGKQVGRQTVPSSDQCGIWVSDFASLRFFSEGPSGLRIDSQGPFGTELDRHVVVPRMKIWTTLPQGDEVIAVSDDRLAIISVPGAKLRTRSCDRLHEDIHLLGSDDAEIAMRSACVLLSDGQAAVKALAVLFKSRGPRDIGEKTRQLASTNPMVRAKAELSLLNDVWQNEDQLNAALKGAELDLRRRIELVLLKGKRMPLPEEGRRLVRGIFVLKTVGSRDSQLLLDYISQYDPSPILRETAQHTVSP